MTLQTSSPAPVTDLPAAAIAQTHERRQTFTTGSLTAARLQLSAIWLTAGQVVSSITYLSGTTTMATPAHQWAALFSPTRALLGQSVDDTSSAWSANTAKTFTLTSPALVTVSGWHYVGLMIDAATPPTLLAVSPGNIIAALAPAIGGASNTGLVATAPATAQTPASGSIPYAYVS